MKLEINNKKYQVIYADPPWRYNFSKSNNRKIENQYVTMDLADIKKLPINNIADENCVLYLWSTSPKLKEGLDVMDSWGFKYKTHMIWDKVIIGMGYWFRNQHELLLVGVKGKFSPPLPKNRKSSVYRKKRSIHSKKPDEIRNLISGWFPNKNRIELFARQTHHGWDSWGNEL